MESSCKYPDYVFVAVMYLPGGEFPKVCVNLHTDVR